MSHFGDQPGHKPQILEPPSRMIQSRLRNVISSGGYFTTVYQVQLYNGYLDSQGKQSPGVAAHIVLYPLCC